MSLQLPPAEQLILESSPLEAVICQLRFHDILRINELPTYFQESIRQTYPVFGRDRGLTIDVASEHPIVASNLGAWQFKTPDQTWIVSLASNFIALKTTNYQHFEKFLEYLSTAVKAFEAVYRPPFYTRIGLRYVNRIIQIRDGGQPVRWDKFLNPYISGEYATEVLREAIEEANHVIVLTAEKGLIGWRYSKDSGRTDESPAERFTLDFDHYLIGQIQPSEITDLLIKFNDTIYRLFRWCVTEEGLKLFDPRPKTREDPREKCQCG